MFELAYHTAIIIRTPIVTVGTQIAAQTQKE